MNIEELKKVLGLPPEATDEDVLTAVKAGAQAIEELAEARARAESSEAEATEAKDGAEEARRDLENEKKAHAATQTALANEKAARADMVLDAAVKERRIGETARETWMTRLVNEGDAAYAALANEKPLSTADRARGLANECGSGTDHEKRMSLVNEIMASDKVGYDEAWTRAEKRDPVLFGKK